MAVRNQNSGSMQDGTFRVMKRFFILTRLMLTQVYTFRKLA